jgi:hypothetical protein
MDQNECNGDILQCGHKLDGANVFNILELSI